MLDSVTNYELYKGLWSSHNDSNYFEIAYSLNRQFGPDGIYKNLSLYNFADNHDVDRIVSMLKDKTHIYPLYILLFTIPGIPSVYYGSECGVPGAKIKESDWPLRPNLDIRDLGTKQENLPLKETVMKLSSISKDLPLLRCGSYRQLLVDHKIFAFGREAGDHKAVVCVNSSKKIANVKIRLPAGWPGRWYDLLNGKEYFEAADGRLNFCVYPDWGRILAAGR